MKRKATETTEDKRVKKERVDVEVALETQYQQDIKDAKSQIKVERQLHTDTAVNTKKEPIKIVKFLDILDKEYNVEPCHRVSEPVDCLVETILSQNTNDKNRDSAYRSLRATYPSWEDVIKAPCASVAKAIRTAGLADKKAPVIVNTLKKIKEDNGGKEISLDFLKPKSNTEVREYLEGISGVGPKTAACVMLFGMGRCEFPVDTHIHRIVRRVGLVPFSYDRIKTQEMMNKIVPKERMYKGHLSIIQHGRRVCTAQKPKCKDCCLKEYCLKKMK